MSRLAAALFSGAVLPLFAATPNGGDEFFEAKIRPLLATHCHVCHSRGALGGLHLDSREGVLKGGKSGKAVVEGKPESSLLIEAVKRTHVRLKMPPVGPLSQQEVANLEEWIRIGLPWPENKQQVQSVAAKITPEQSDAFAANPDKAKAIDRLLASPQYGERWARHWLDLRIHAKLARQSDGPIAALVDDLKARGLFDETLIVITGEFGRTPMIQNSGLEKLGCGRDHNPPAFTALLAGGGIKGGIAYGATDDFGYKAIENKVHVHDLHATILNQLGFDHTRLTYRYAGRDFRLTDVHGEVVKSILA
jgi:mono/diheme cytochrome c family protein